MKFFNLGAGEIVLILLFAIIAVGPKETIRLAGQVRDIIRNVQEVFSDLTSEVSRLAEDITEIPENKRGDN
jgi:Sec-independent protein translocase protein TatA